MREMLKCFASGIVERIARGQGDRDLQVVEDDAFPLAVDQDERRFDRTARPMGEIPPFHGLFPGILPIVSKQGLYPRIYSTCQCCATPTFRRAPSHWRQQA